MATASDAAADQAQRPSKKRNRASQACATCNRKKTKCDVSQTGVPCTKCRESSSDCQLMESKRGKYDRSKMHNNNSASPTGPASDNIPVILDALHTAHAQVQAHQSGTVAPQATSTHVVPSSASITGLQGLSALLSGGVPGPQASTSQHQQQHTTFDDLARFMPSLARTESHSHTLSPTEKQRAGPSSELTSTFQSHNVQAEELNRAFTFNFDDDNVLGSATSGGLPGLNPSTQAVQAAPPAAQSDPDVESGEWLDLMALPLDRLEHNHTSHNVMYAEDLFTLSHLLRQHWTSQSDKAIPSDRVHFPGGPAGPSGASAILLEQSHSQMQYLSSIGCFTLPPKSVLNPMLEAYFAYFHPVYPILDRGKFQEQYESVYAGGVSILLLWGMLYVSTTLCDIQHIKSAGFPSRFDALKSFCVRGKALYNASYERHKANVVIFECLISHIWSEGEDSFVWSGRAVVTAQSLGMHRTTINSKLLDEDRRLWRRIWWTVYIRDRHAAAATGRPYRITEMFCDIEYPQREDFETEPLYLRFLHSVKLAQIVGKVVECKRTSRDDLVAEQDKVYKLLNDWFAALPQELAASRSPSDIFIAFLHISYHCWVIHLFRSRFQEDVQNAIASQSAAAATRLFEDLLQQNRVGQGPQFTVTCLFAAMAQLLIDRRRATGTFKLLCSNRLEICKLASKELASMRPVAAWFKRIFRSLGTQTPSGEEKNIQHSNSDPAAFAFGSSHDMPTFSNTTQGGMSDSATPSGHFADFFWGMPNEFSNDAALDWLLETS